MVICLKGLEMNYLAVCGRFLNEIFYYSTWDQQLQPAIWPPSWPQQWSWPSFCQFPSYHLSWQGFQPYLKNIKMRTCKPKSTVSYSSYNSIISLEADTVLAKLEAFSGILTLSETTNFRLVQIERVCRQQFQFCWKWQKALKTGRKHCGKRRNCSYTSNFSFSHVFKRLVLQT